jgi:hypothetical protein
MAASNGSSRPAVFLDHMIKPSILMSCLCSDAYTAGYTSRGALFKASSESLPAMAAEGQLWSSGVVSGDLQPGLAWLASLLEKMSGHLDKDCFRQAWSAAAAAINRCLRCHFMFYNIS